MRGLDVNMPQPIVWKNIDDGNSSEAEHLVTGSHTNVDATFPMAYHYAMRKMALFSSSMLGDCIVPKR